MHRRWIPYLIGTFLPVLSMGPAAAQPAAPAAELHVLPGAPEEEPPPSECPPEPAAPAATPVPVPAAVQGPPAAVPLAAAPLPVARALAPSRPAPRAKPDSLSVRELAGHAFIPSVLLADAFPVTTFGVFTAGTFASGSAVVDAADGSGPQALSLAQAAASHGFALQLGMTRFLAAGLSLRGSVTSGLTQDALALSGTDAGFSVSTHVLGSIPIRERIRVALQLEIDYSQNYNVNVVEPLRTAFAESVRSLSDLLDRLDGIEQRLLQRRSVLTIAPRAILAVGLHRAIGLRVQLGYAHQTVLSGDTAAVPCPSAGLLFSWDLGAVTRVPVGLLTGYRLDAMLLESGDRIAHSLHAGLFYTGRRHLSLGIEGGAMLQRPFFSATLTELQALFTMKHFW